MADSEKELWSDPDTYEAMQQPFESADAANEAMRAMFKDLGELRKKHRMANVTMVVNMRVRYPDKKVGETISWVHYGDSLREESMLAFAYGQASADRRESLAKLLAGKK